jgi:hypothetical protein
VVEARSGRHVEPVGIRATHALGPAHFEGHEMTVATPAFRGVTHPFGGEGRVVTPERSVGVAHLVNERALSRPGVQPITPYVRPAPLPTRPMPQPKPKPVPPRAEEHR